MVGVSQWRVQCVLVWLWGLTGACFFLALGEGGAGERERGMEGRGREKRGRGEGEVEGADIIREGAETASAIQ